MIKRIVEISTEPFHLSVRWNQLQLRRHETDAEPVATIPCEDLGVVVVDHPATTYSHQALLALVDAGAAVVLCGPKHLPTGMLLPQAAHTNVVWRLQHQIEAGRPLRKRLWKQIVRVKIRNQAAELPADHPTRQRLLDMALQVRSGDPENHEAQAAKLYWEVWGGGTFRRDPDGTDVVNGMLNYGYAIVRSAWARALVAAGFNPALGLFHRNRSNPFCLADDLMEPMRPWVDTIVARLAGENRNDVDRTAKQALLGLLHREVRTGDQTGPLLVALHRSCASLDRCLQGKEKRLQLPAQVK
jgi:CRISPR-associated protein Cas1